MSLSQQVRLMYNTDIILSGHGSALANAMFARPHSALIECHPPYFYEMCFANIAFISRLFYVAVTIMIRRY